MSACGCQTPACAPDANAAEAAAASCSGGESFALRVLGEDMAPEFLHGEIIVVEPDGALHDGSYVLARQGDEWLFRQLCQRAEGWALRALKAGLTELPLADLQAVHGVVIQKAVPGRRRLSKFYK